MNRNLPPTIRQYRLYQRLQVAAIAVLFLILPALVVFLASRPYKTQHPLDLAGSGVRGVYNLRDRDGKLVLANFREVEPGVLYRGSGFIEFDQAENPTGKDQLKAKPASGEVFKFLRSKGIRTVFSLLPREKFEAEKGYFDWHGKRTGYRIKVVSLPVIERQADNGLGFYDDRGWHGSLRAATEFIELMKKRQPQDGAVYLHCSAGKDRTGIVIAAYELWRNRGVLDRDTLWQKVLNRYLVSDTLLNRAPDAKRFAGEKATCDDGKKGYVCDEWLEKLRGDLEFIAQL